MIPFLLPYQLPIQPQQVDNHNIYVLGTGVFILYITYRINMHYICV